MIAPLDRPLGSPPSDRQPIVAGGIDRDALSALEAVAGLCDLKPALLGEIDPSRPSDLRTLPQPIQPPGTAR